MFPNRLKVARKAMKYTQEELAELVVTTKGTISNYENGHSTPSIEILLLLSSKLEVSVDFLLGNDDIDTSDIELFSKEELLIIKNNLNESKIKLESIISKIEKLLK